MGKGIFILALILCLGVVAACGGCCERDCDEFLSYKKIDNPNRYPVEVYALGYSYRATDDFKMKHGFTDDVKVKKRVVYFNWNKDYYYKIIPYLKTVERVECYHAAPRGKLFYVKCP